MPRFLVSFLLEKLLDWHVQEEGIWVFWGKVGLRGRDESDFQLHSKRKITINFLPWTVTFPLIFDSEVKRFVKLLYIYIFVNVQRKKLEK